MLYRFVQPSQVCHSSSSLTHQWELEPKRRVLRVLLPGQSPFPVLHLVHTGNCFNPALHGQPAGLAGSCCKLAQLDVSHTLSWLSCVAENAAAWPSPVCPQTQPTLVLMSAAALPGLDQFSLGYCATRAAAWEGSSPRSSICADKCHDSAWHGLSVLTFSCASGSCSSLAKSTQA